jgi:hypothetical protein
MAYGKTENDLVILRIAPRTSACRGVVLLFVPVPGARCDRWPGRLILLGAALIQ